jgi:hypothetical protein
MPSEETAEVARGAGDENGHQLVRTYRAISITNRYLDVRMGRPADAFHVME